MKRSTANLIQANRDKWGGELCRRGRAVHRLQEYLDLPSWSGWMELNDIVAVIVIAMTTQIQDINYCNKL